MLSGMRVILIWLHSVPQKKVESIILEMTFRMPLLRSTALAKQYHQ